MAGKYSLVPRCTETGQMLAETLIKDPKLNEIIYVILTIHSPLTCLCHGFYCFQLTTGQSTRQTPPIRAFTSIPPHSPRSRSHPSASHNHKARDGPLHSQGTFPQTRYARLDSRPNSS